jgi:hypothetical protein
LVTPEDEFSGPAQFQRMTSHNWLGPGMSPSRDLLSPESQVAKSEKRLQKLISSTIECHQNSKKHGGPFFLS